MAKQLFTNDAKTTLSGVMTNGGTSMNVVSGSGFPVVNGTGDYFLATIYQHDLSNNEEKIEVVKVTDMVTSVNWTIVRDVESMVVAQGGPAGGWAYPVGGATTVYIELRLTALAANNFTSRDLNLSDMADAPTARTNLGLGTMATQNADAVALTGDLSNTATGGLQVAHGTTAQRPANGAGKLRYNSDYARFEGNNGAAWSGLGGAAGAGGDAIFYENGQTVTTDYTVVSTVNSMSAGPITINGGVTVTIQSGGSWTVVGP